MAGRSLSKLALLAAGFLLALLAAELVSHALGYDWERKEEAQRAVPPFYRQPRVEVGPVFFRRQGPEQWTGNVLSTHFRKLYGDLDPERDPYAALPDVSVRYDDLGFRNAPDLDEWRVVVVGDSFTELGYLEDDDLFSSVAARKLAVPIKNLGVSYTGPATHNFYLQEYGASTGLEHAVLAFFEGNDLLNLAAENGALARLEAGEPRPTRRIEPQSSLFRYLASRLDREPEVLPLPRHEARYLGSSDGIPVDLRYSPAPRLGEQSAGQLGGALGAWAAQARALGARPWLLYLPAKIRALHGHLKFEDTAKPRLRHWRPGTLKQEIAALAAAHGVGFIDPTPKLQREVAARRLPYNSLWDTHFNRHGSRIVGGVLADALAGSAPGADGARADRTE